MTVARTGKKNNKLSITNTQSGYVSELKRDSCPSCNSGRISCFYEVSGVPVQSVLLIHSREIASNYPKGDMALGFCQACGFVWNKIFNHTRLEYSSTYESTQSFSPTFNAFTRQLATRLIARYNLHGKVIIEIGCGNGEFLSILCELGDNRGIGFDPAYSRERSNSAAKKRMTFIKDYYSNKYANYKADLICCKMTLEHIQPVANFVDTVRRSIEISRDTIVFFQVPDASRILRDCAIEDIYYEHCSYFSAGSLARLFRKCGFDILRLERAYDHQYLLIEAKVGTGNLSPQLSLEDDLEELKGYVSSFPERSRDKLRFWQDRLLAIHEDGKRAVIWGSGSKCTAFLAALEIRNKIEYVVDINPFRQGTYMAGTGQEIVSPDFLKTYRPDVVILMNAVYLKEICQDLNRMGLAPELLTV